jgi:hypothetical protein
MSRVFIGRSFNDVTFVLLSGLWLIGTLGLGAVCVTQQTVPHVVVVGVCLTVLAIIAARGDPQPAGRRWLSWSRDGITVEGRGEPVFVPDDRVTSLGFWSRPHYESGTAKHMLVTGELVAEDADGEPVRVPFRYQYKLDGVDSLLPWRVRVLDLLEEKAAQMIARGGSFATAHWELDRDGLTWTDRRERKHIPTADLAAADIADGGLCVWQGDDERPAFKLQNGSPNAMVLWGLLEKRIPTDRTPRPAVADGLGRVLCDRNLAGSAVVRGALGLFAAFLLLSGVAGVVASFKDIKFLLPGVLGVLAGGGLLFAAWLDGGNVISIHTNGVSQRRRFGTRRIRFLDLIAMKWTETAQHLKGVYVGTRVAAKLTALDGTVVRVDASVNNADFDLDKLRVTAATQVARRLRGELARGRRVRWVGRLTFTPDGLAVASAFALFGGREQVLPYSGLGWELANGKIRLWSRDSKLTVGVNVAAENFQPGLVLLNVLNTAPYTHVISRPDEVTA